LEEYFLSLIRGDRRGVWPWLERLGLRGLSIPYGWVVRCRNGLFDRGLKKTYAAPVPVVSVGNLTLGGTGKTPCVEYVARFFRRLDRRVAILSRGYGTREGRNDEALVLEENLPDVPHLQGADRVALAQTAVEELESEVLILDDGFQHRRLRRDLDIVLIDATAPWGHGHLFPRGLLREPPSSLRRAHLAMLTRCDLAGTDVIQGIRQRVSRLAPEIPIVSTTHRPAAWINADRATRPLDSVAGPCAAFCGIGNPEAFRASLTNLGLELTAWRTFPDHHAYIRQDIDSLRKWVSELPPNVNVVTTQKDLVKIRLARLGDHELWALQIQLQVVDGEDLLEQKLRHVLPRRVE
jgi:tetraacyldisaccharide 4'-kinase